MDYYEEARRIAQLLAADGLDEEARSVLDAIETGSTATEILMGIRYHLEPLHPSASSKTTTEVGKLLVEIKKALAP